MVTIPKGIAATPFWSQGSVLVCITMGRAQLSQVSVSDLVVSLEGASTAVYRV